MKTKEECMLLALMRHPKGTKNGMSHNEYTQVFAEAALSAMEAYHAQFEISDSDLREAFEAGREGNIEKVYVPIDQYGGINVEEHFIPNKYPTFEDYLKSKTTRSQLKTKGK